MAENELAKYLSIYRKRRKEDDDQLGGAWPDYQGAAAGYSAGSGGGGVGGVGNAGGYVAPGASLNALQAFASGAPQQQEDQGSGGGGQPEGPQPGEPGTLEDALTGLLAVNPIGPLALMSFVGLSEKEKAQEDINLGLNTARAKFGSALGMTANKDPYSYGPSEAAGFTDQPSAPPSPGYSDIGVDPGATSGGPPGSSYGGGAPASPGYSDIGVDPGATSGEGGGPSGGGGSGADSGEGGPPGGFAYGGPVDESQLVGPDPAGPDQGFAPLRDNEFVIQPQAAEYYGPEILDALNSGEIPREALMQMLQGSQVEMMPQNNLSAMAPKGRNNLAMMAR